MSQSNARLISVAGRIDALTAAVGRWTAWCIVAIVVIQFAVVALRYAAGAGSIWLQETIVYAHAALLLLAAAWTLQVNGHVRVDIFYADASARTKAKIDLFGALVFLLPFAAVLLWFSTPYVARSWATLERSRETSGLPFVFLLKTLIPVTALLLGLQGVSQAIRAWTALRHGGGEQQGLR